MSLRRRLHRAVAFEELRGLTMMDAQIIKSGAPGDEVRLTAYGGRVFSLKYEPD